MNRIKFRAWDKKNRQLVPVTSIDFDSAGNIEEVNTVTYCWFGDGRERGSLDGIILMQCTGLEDRNGKAIWEGDVLFFHGKNKQARFPHNLVFWHEKKARWCVKVLGSRHPDHQEISLDFERLADFNNGGHYTVIGNQYENPELLNETDQI